MKHLAGIIAFLAALNGAPLWAADVPRSVAGFTLGQKIANFQDRLQMETALPLRYQEYLREVEIASLPGFKSGLITYGTCMPSDRIVRIKLKYADASRSFYDALLAQVERRFGKATSYEGDAFHIVIDWKWSFIDADGNRVTLHLSHNSRDTEEKFGNAIKLTLLSAIEEERQCFIEKHPPAQKPDADRPKPLKSMTAEDWEPFLPR